MPDYKPYSKKSPIVVPQASFREAMSGAAGAMIDPDDADWRPLSGDSSRDLAPMTQRRMQDIAVYLWEQNVLANRLIELPIAYILAEGVRLSSEDEAAQEILDKFWDHPINNMDIKLVKKVRELALYGEQCWPAFVNEFDGSVRLGYLDPGLIETVVVDPDNGEQPIGIVTVKNKKGEAKRYRVIVNGKEDDLFTARTVGIRQTFTDGDCFYFSINDLSNGRRGRSDLLSQGDWLDGYDQFLFGELERIQFLRAFMWDVTLVGATGDEVKAKAKTITAPKPGSTRVHNDQEIWKAESPTIGATDTEDSARLFRNHCLGGATIPEHWFGGAGDVNRATGEDMASATFKVMSMRQTFIGHMLVTVGRFVVRQWQAKGGHSMSEDEGEQIDVCVSWPEMIAKDTTKYAAALQQVVTAVGLAVSGKLLSRETAIELIQSVAGRLGVEFDAEEELAKMEAEPAGSLSGAEGSAAEVNAAEPKPVRPEPFVSAQDRPVEGQIKLTEAVNLRAVTEANPADTPGEMIEQLGKAAEPAIDTMLQSIKAMLDSANDLPDAMKKLAGLFPELESNELTDILAQALTASYLAGVSDVADGQ